MDFPKNHSVLFHNISLIPHYLVVEPGFMNFYRDLLYHLTF